MMPPLIRIPLFLLLCLALAGAGCTKQARMERKLASGNRLVEAGDFRGAEAEYRAALQLVPEDAQVMGRIGIMIYRQGRPLSAYYVLNGVRESVPDDLDVQLYYGLACLSLARTADARMVAKKIVEVRPDNEEVLLMLVDTCLTTRDNEESQRLVAKAREQSKTNTGIHDVALGGLQLARKEDAAAEASFRKALEINPQSAVAYTYLGILAASQDKMVEAGAAFKKAAELSPMRSSRRIKYADFLMKEGAYDESRREVTKIIEATPDYVPAWGIKMKLAFLQEKYQESDEAAAEVLSRDRANFEALMQRALIKLVKSDIEGVIDDLKKTEGLFERAPQVKYQLALAYLKYGNPGRAEDYLTQALRLSPNYEEAIMLFSELQMHKGLPGNAVVALSRMLQRRPNLARGYVLLARAYRAQGNLAKCLEVLQVLESGFPKVADGPYLVGTILVELERNKEAREAFERSLKQNPNYWPAVEGLVNLDLLENQGAAALERIKGLVEKNPKAVTLWLLRAKIRLFAGDPAGSEEDLLKAIDLEPKAQYPYLLLARIYFHTERAKDALGKIQLLAAKKPTANVLMQLGMLHSSLKQYAEARASYEKVLALDPDFTPALNNLAVLYSQNPAQLEKGYDLAKQAQTLRPNDPVVADTLGWVLFRKGQYDRALRLAQQAVEQIPGDPAIQYHLGMVQYYLGQFESARQAFQAVVSAVGDSEVREDAIRRLAILALDPANPDPAIRTQLERAVREDPNDPVALGRLAQIELRAGEAREAAEHYEAVLKINPGAVPAMVALVQLNFGPLAKLERAKELVKLVRSAAPGDQELAAQMGHYLVEAGDYVGAFPMLAEATRAFPGRPDVHYDLAQSHYGLGRVGEAEKSLAAALAIEGPFVARKQAAGMASLLAAIKQPVLKDADVQAARAAILDDADNIPALMLVALYQERNKDYRDAVQTYEKVLKSNPGFAPAMRQLAVLYGEQLGDDEKAEQLAMKAKETLTEDVEIDYLMGVINYRRANYEGAARFLGQSLRKRPNHPETLFFLGMTHFQLKNSTEARVELQKAVSLKLPPQEETEAKRVLEMINRGGAQ